ncbi:30S ribosomal protein S6 [Bartonella sp. TP]|uniref:30S ribosomal protein S6 n=1 Tax=Bartonella sp. TP TaxID=3057550 RepID=UPI0025AF4490|nr:30S ribosomal protein S6 [Bartonella sp. TP]MDN5249164.1 30S ribosomal protein S6 [Alphaproteobacteria bacterium]WJW80126.1 30S ribosomal protein S6 [Bartonella sp. TP]
MALYEHIFMARQDITQQQVDQLISNYKEVITSNGGKVGRVEYWGLRTLAYRINKNRKAHYVLMDLDAEAPVIAELERQMRLNEDILRYMTVRVKEHEKGPSVVLAKRDKDEYNFKSDDRFRPSRQDINTTAMQGDL